MGDVLPEELRDFLARHISSVEQLEVLLLLRADPTVAHNAEEISRILRTSPASIAARLQDLANRGLAAARTDEGGARVYVFASDGPDAPTVAVLAAFYASHRVTIIDAIFTRPKQMLQTLADAFRLKERK